MAISSVPGSLPLQGTVDAAGRLVVKFGPNYSEKWNVTQVSLEMPDAPAGSTAEVRRMGSLIAPAPSPRRATASGDPSIFLYGGEFMTVEWTDCTTGDIGRVLVIYEKSTY